MHQASHAFKTPIPREDLVKAIISDNELFRALKKRIRATGVITNECAEFFINSYILESMKSEVTGKFPITDVPRTFSSGKRRQLFVSPYLLNREIPRVITDYDEKLPPKTPDAWRLPLKSLHTATTRGHHGSSGRRSPWSIDAFARITSRFNENMGRLSGTSVADTEFQHGGTCASNKSRKPDFDSPDQSRVYAVATSVKRTKTGRSSSFMNKIRRSFGSPFDLNSSFTSPLRQVNNALSQNGRPHSSIQDFKTNENLHAIKYKSIDHFETPGKASIRGLLTATNPYTQALTTPETKHESDTFEQGNIKTLLSPKFSVLDDLSREENSVDAARRRSSLWSPEVLAEMFEDLGEDESNDSTSSLQGHDLRDDIN